MSDTKKKENKKEIIRESKTEKTVWIIVGISLAILFVYFLGFALGLYYGMHHPM